MKIAQIPLTKGASNQKPERIVIHSMAEFIDTDPHDYYAPEFLRKIGLSAHAFITPSGVIIQSRKHSQGAYHSKGYNTDSLGIEFLVPGIHTYSTFVEAIKTPYLTDIQYRAGVDLVRRLIKEYDIKSIDRHSDLSPTRKVDPGEGFPWNRFISEARIEVCGK